MSRCFLAASGQGSDGVVIGKGGGSASCFEDFSDFLDKRVTNIGVNVEFGARAERSKLQDSVADMAVIDNYPADEISLWQHP